MHALAFYCSHSRRAFVLIYFYIKLTRWIIYVHYDCQKFDILLKFIFMHAIIYGKVFCCRHTHSLYLAETKTNECIFCCCCCCLMMLLTLRRRCYSLFACSPVCCCFPQCWSYKEMACGKVAREIVYKHPIDRFRHRCCRRCHQFIFATQTYIYIYIVEQVKRIQRLRDEQSSKYHKSHWEWTRAKME